MRIISGTARGIILSVPDGLSVRPTSVRARKALFDSMGSFAGLKVCDLFSGSGALALEAASRGASECILIEKSHRHIKSINDNIAKVLRAGTESSIEVLCSDVRHFDRYAAKAGGSQIVFADPPYHFSADIFSNLIESPDFAGIFPEALLVWEIPDSKNDVFNSFTGNGFWQMEKRRKFGRTEFLFLIQKY